MFVNITNMYEDNNNITTDGYRVMITPNDWIRVAPARYSNVQKVIFSATVAWFENNAARNVDAALLVGPMSSNQNVKNIQGLVFPIGGHVAQTAARYTPWLWKPRNGANVNFMDNMLYPQRGPTVTLNGLPVTPGTWKDSQTLTLEFDRDNPAHADFFADWDGVAAGGDDDEYVGYSPNIGFVESTFVAGSTANLVGTGFAIHVVQNPALVNDTCTVLECGRLCFLTPNLLVGRRNTFGYNNDFPNTGAGRFTFNADEWDGISQMCLWSSQGVGLIVPGPGGTERAIQVVIDNAPNQAATILDSRSFDDLAGALRQDVIRSADVKALVGDGNVISADYLVEGNFGDLNCGPTEQMEIVQKACTKTVYVMDLGRGNGNAVSDQVNGQGNFYYDRDTFWDEFPLATITEKRFSGTLVHEAMAFLLQYFARWDTDLNGRDDGPAGFTSPTAVTVLPCQINSSGQDDGLNPQMVYLTCASIVNDPLDLAGGPRKVYMKTTGAVVGTDDVQVASIMYAHAVPNSTDPGQFTPQLGPLFAIGSFNPLGCVSTSAGLGDAPAVLILTNGAVIPKKFNPTAMVIQNAGIDTPYRDQEPSASFISVALSPAGGLTPGIYKYRYTLRNACTQKESDPNPVDIFVDVSAASPAAEVTLNFAGVSIPADSQIDQICIYRTILGGDFPVMAKVGCFDIPGTSIFVDSLSDSELDFINDPLDNFQAPMPCVAVVEEFRNRLWGLVDVPDLNPPGTVGVTFDSDLIQGDQDTEFDRCILGKFIQIEGDCTAYEVIECLLPTSGLSPLQGMQLKLDREYEGTTDEGLNFIVCGHPNRLYISEPIAAECWPAINFLDVDPGDGDLLIGANSNFNRLLICKRRKTYVVAFREQPIIEIVVPTLIGRDIGCIASRSFAQIASGTVWLSDRGLALYDGRGVSMVPESSVMNDLFVNPDNPNYMRRDPNGITVGAAGVYYPKREQYLLLIPTVKTERGASLILVWDTELRNVTLLEFCQEFLSIEVAKDDEGNERIYLGDTNGFVWIWDVGDTDGVGFPNATGTVRGTVTAAGIEPLIGSSFLDDSNAGFLVGGVPGLGNLSGISGFSGLSGQSIMGMAGACVFWRPADSGLDVPWKSRFVYASTATRLFVTPNWGVEIPSVGDEYMIGPIEFRAEFKPANYGTDDFSKREWRQIVVHEQEEVSTVLRTELLRDFQNSDIDEDTVTDPDGATGEGRVYDLGFGKGRQIRPVGRLVHNFMGVRLSNFAPEEPLTIINHVLGLVPRQSK
jgi:hypothetical protein